MNKVTERFKKMMLASMGIFTIDILVGIIFLIFDSLSDKVCVVILGSLFFIHGLFYMIRFIYDGLGKKVFSVDVIFGVETIILGMFMMFAPIGLLSNYLLFYGIGLCIMGLEMMCYGIVFKTKHEEIFPIITLTSILVIMMGVVSIINPFSRFILTLKLISFFSITTGVFGCVYSSLFKKRTKAILDMYK